MVQNLARRLSALSSFFKAPHGPLATHVVLGMLRARSHLVLVYPPNQRRMCGLWVRLTSCQRRPIGLTDQLPGIFFCMSHLTFHVCRVLLHTCGPHYLRRISPESGDSPGANLVDRSYGLISFFDVEATSKPHRSPPGKLADLFPVPTLTSTKLLVPDPSGTPLRQRFQLPHHARAHTLTWNWGFDEVVGWRFSWLVNVRLVEPEYVDAGPLHLSRAETNVASSVKRNRSGTDVILGCGKTKCSSDRKILRWKPEIYHGRKFQGGSRQGKSRQASTHRDAGRAIYPSTPRLQEGGRGTGSEPV